MMNELHLSIRGANLVITKSIRTEWPPHSIGTVAAVQGRTSCPSSECRQTSSNGESVLQLARCVDSCVGLSCSTQLLLWLDESVAAVVTVRTARSLTAGLLPSWRPGRRCPRASEVVWC